MAERVGFEPTWDLRPQRISSPRRYVHFGTSPAIQETGSHFKQIDPLGRRGRCGAVGNIRNEIFVRSGDQSSPQEIHFNLSVFLSGISQS